MTISWFPLLIDPPSDGPNDDGNVTPDKARGQIYTYDGFLNSFVISRIWTHDYNTGAALASKLVSAVCTISGNTFVNLPAVALGTNGFLYAMTSQGTTGAPQLAHSVLSKIDPASMTEAATLVPYAIAHAGTYFITDAGDFRLVAFVLNSVNYLALMLNASSPANIEIINADTMTSVITYDYTGSGSATHLVVGQQPTSTSQKLYIMEESPGGDSDRVEFVVATFTTTPTISDAPIATILSTTIDAAWTGFPILYPTCLMFCPIDNSLVFFVLNDDAAIAKIVKIDTSVGGIAWTPILITNQIFYIGDYIGNGTAALCDLSSNDLGFCDPNSPTFFRINLADGSYTTLTSPHLDGNPSDNGVSNCPIWDGPNNRLTYFYEGANDLSPAWPTGGWATFSEVSGVSLEASTNIQVKGRLVQPVPAPPPPNPPPPTPPNPFNCLVPVISQYANSPILLTILENFCEAVDPFPLINEFYNYLWNINTARGYGLDVWGRIVGVTRVLEIPAGRFFGHQEQAGSTDPYNSSPFFTGFQSGESFSLSDDSFRLLILVKALANITDGSVKSSNTILRTLFGGSGNAYVQDGLNMTMVYTFEFPLSPVQAAIVNQSGVLSRSTGVSASVSVPI